MKSIILSPFGGRAVLGALLVLSAQGSVLAQSYQQYCAPDTADSRYICKPAEVGPWRYSGLSYPHPRANVRGLSSLDEVLTSWETYLTTKAGWCSASASVVSVRYAGANTYDYSVRTVGTLSQPKCISSFDSTYPFEAHAWRSVSCPDGTIGPVYKGDVEPWEPYCVYTRTEPADPPCQTCPCPGSKQDGTGFGNPIIPATAEKYERQEDLSLPEPHGMVLARTYRSGRVGGATPSANAISASRVGSGEGGATPTRGVVYVEHAKSEIGEGWSLNLAGRLTLHNSVTQGPSTGTLGWATISLGDGRYRSFVPTGTETWKAIGDNKDKFWAVHPDGVRSVNSEYFFQPIDSDEQYVFKSATNQQFSPLNTNFAYLSAIKGRNGWTTTFTYDTSMSAERQHLLSIRNQFGHRIELTYTADDLVSEVRHINPSGSLVQSVRYTFDEQRRLTSVRYADDSVRQYHYEDSNNPFWLTGYSLNGQRVGTYRYDEMGRAVETTHPGGLDRYQVSYTTLSGGIYSNVSVIDPLGTSRSYVYSLKEHRLNVIRASVHPFDHDANPIKSRTVNSFGYVRSESNFKGNSYSSTTYDEERALPTAENYGAGLKGTNYTWHPTFRLPTQIDEKGGRRTVLEYDTKGNLLRKTVTSTSGAVVNEVWSWTYNSAGLTASETDPRGATTTYQYNAAGQLTRQLNALGQATSYAYDANGMVSRITEPSGLSRYFYYTPRGWLKAMTLSAGGVNLATAFAYTPDGQIKSAAFPNGYTITYSYDAGLRNNGWSDNRGQRVNHTLDAAGNATEEQHRNANGQLALQIRRSISALNRVQSETTGTGVTETFAQDANGRTNSVTDATGKTTTIGRDTLERFKSVTDANGRQASINYNAQDAVTQIIDFKNVTTKYTRDVQGNARSEATPDAGTTASTYDALGLPSRIVDAIGRATDIERDALGRPTRITHSVSGGKTLTTELRYDLAGSSSCNVSGQVNAAIGRLCQMVDKVDGVEHVQTQYQWDAFGRLNAQTQTLSSAIANHSLVQRTAYTYVASGAGKGELASITYPSGAVLTHQYDTTGRLKGLLWNGQPLIENLQYNVLGQPLSWTWAFGSTGGPTLQASRQYDTAGQLTGSEFARFVPDATGRIGSVTQKLLKSNGTGGWVEEEVPFNALYDALGQLTSFQAQGTSPVFQWGHTYTYDFNANRTGGTITANGASMSFTNAFINNRQSKVAGVTVVSNAAGDISSVLGKTLQYDAAGRLSQASAVPPCPSGNNCVGAQTTISRFNGWGQRYLRENEQEQSVFGYGPQGFELLTQTRRNLASSALRSTEHIWLPTASGPMPIAAVIDGVHYAVHADHLNTPRRLSDSSGQSRWQWPYSGFGEIAPQSTPTTGQAPVNYSLRYPGQIDDGNELFYNWHRFYDPRLGRYVSSDPIGLEGGFNRFGYVGGNPLSGSDSRGLFDDALPAPIAVPSVYALCEMHPLACAGAGGFAAGSLLYPLIERPLSSVIDRCMSSNPEPESCDPPEGTVCSVYHESGAPHKASDFDGNGLGKIVPHVHTYQQNRLPNGRCEWNFRSAAKHTFNFTPIDARPCQSYPSWVSKFGK